MPFTSVNKTAEPGFTLVEMLVAIAITSIGATAVIPVLQTRFRQAAVDSYTQKIEAGLTQLKANMIGRQDSCIIYFPEGSGSETEFSPEDIDRISIEEERDDGAEADCPKPSKMGGKTMATTKLRLLSIRNTQSANDQTDLKILISPESISLNTVGGVTAPRALDSTEVSQPLVIRIRSERLTNQGRGLERCVIMEPTTGEISSGSWHGASFNSGRCRSSKQ